MRTALIRTLLVLCFGGLGAAQNQFTVHTAVRVTTNAVKVRAAPGLAGDVLGIQEHGALGEVVDASPHYADGYWWWRIDYRDGPDGWSADGDAAEPYVWFADDAPPDDSVEAAQEADEPAGPIEARVYFVELDLAGSYAIDGPFVHDLTPIGDGEYMTQEYRCGPSTCLTAIAVESEHRWAAEQSDVAIVEYQQIAFGDEAITLLVFDHDAREPYRAVTWSYAHGDELVFGRFARSPDILTRASLQVVHSTSAELSLVFRILDVIEARTDGTTQDFLRLLATVL